MTQALAFFGAFNPPTVAHIHLAEFALRETDSREVVFVPSRSAYIRGDQGKDYAYDDRLRAQMLAEAAKARPWMAVCDWELRQERQPRTYETLCHLRDEGRTCALLMGSDKLPELEHIWLHVEDIAREFGIVCMSRGGDACEALINGDPYLRTLAPYIRVLEAPEETQRVSSTQVRQAISEIRRLQAEVGALVPPEILPLL